MKFVKFFFPMLLVSTSFAGNIEFSPSAQLTVKRTLELALPLKSSLASRNNGAILCFEKFASDLASANNNVNDLINQEKYSNIKAKIEMILQSAQKDQELAELRAKAVSENTTEVWQNIKIAIYHFIGSQMETKMPKRFSKQLRGERDFAAWLNRNEKLDPIDDYGDVVAGFIGQFYVAEIITSH